MTPVGFGQTDLVFSQIIPSGGYWTGLVLSNPSQTAVTATIELDSAAGTALEAMTVTITAGQQTTGLISDFFLPASTQAGGFIHVTASQPIYGLAIFGRTTGSPFLSFIPGGPY